MAREERQAHGNYPVGGAVGAAGGAVAGAAIGAIGGPVGMVAGGVAGAVLGASAGAGYAKWIDQTAEESFWRENHDRQPHQESGHSYEDYAPAYRLGFSAPARYAGEDWSTAEAKLQADWERERGNSRLEWHQARHATRAAWDRVQQQLRQSMGGDEERR